MSKKLGEGDSEGRDSWNGGTLGSSTETSGCRNLLEYLRATVINIPSNGG